MGRQARGRSEAGFQAHPQIAQTQSLLRRKRWSVEKVFHCDSKLSVAQPALNPNCSAFRQSGDAVFDCIFDERLKQQRRDAAIPAIFSCLHVHLQSGAESYLFHV
jgi:hypothetical protein